MVLSTEANKLPSRSCGAVGSGVMFCASLRSANEVLWLWLNNNFYIASFKEDFTSFSPLITFYLSVVGDLETQRNDSLSDENDKTARFQRNSAERTRLESQGDSQLQADGSGKPECRVSLSA